MLALELDPENNLMPDSNYTYDRDLKIESDYQNQVINKLYLFDGREDVYKIVQECGL